MISSFATIIIPIAPHHSSLAERAADSARAQTITCDVIQVFDRHQRGAGWARNTGAAQCDTPFVIFLDADDVLDPAFAEHCLEAYEPPHYIYTSWWLREGVQDIPCLCVDADHDYHSHLVTTLYPTAIFKALGGFDDSLPGHEDVDFYLRSAREGICGTHLDKPLLHYTEHGWRSKQFNERADKKAIMDRIYLRNGGQRTAMACCGQPGTKAQMNPGEMQPGDVLAETLWAGMRTEYSGDTGRLYTGGNGATIYVNPKDLDLISREGSLLFRMVKDLRKLAPEREKILKESGLV